MPGGCADDGNLGGSAVESGKYRQHTSPLNNYTASLPVSNPTASPWQAEPSRYATYKSSPRVPGEAQVCIIGTGLSGVSIAHHLLTRDPTVSITLLEARTLCSGASGRNGGHLTCDLFSFAPALLKAGFTKSQVSAYAQFEIDNFNALTSLIQECSIECEYRRKKHFDVCVTTEELRAAIHGLECMRDCGGPVSDVRVLYDDEASKVAGVTCKGLIEHGYSASINPYKLVTGILGCLMTQYKDRLTLYTDTPVASIDGSTVTTTNNDTIVCGYIVVATNGYTASLLPALKTVIVPVRGQVLSRLLNSDDSTDSREVQNCSFSMGGEYLSQRPDRYIILGGGRRFAKNQEIGNADDSWISSRVSTVLDTFADKLAESLTGEEEEADEEKKKSMGSEKGKKWEWTGIMGYAKLGIPLVTQWQEAKNTFICAGFTGHGMPRIFLSAKYLSSLILTKSSGSSSSSSSIARTDEIPSGYEVVRYMVDTDLADH